ncbi:hypothetical protein EDB81DRAFT_802280 [Dactylonectria macrodidyma]|uniref:SAP domain-containing protein n=1 Tax=Dactylonectria macrodidyma TaxID=307937 RepID=A0A9P9EG51_9HYPO|nr:hypothetical protein EDB81DRAFT_802280 [Dactylonectria macrodidyma]
MTTDWAKLRVVDLKEELKRRGLQPNGLKVELVARLTEAENKPAQDESAPPEEPVAKESPATEPLPDLEASEGTVEEYMEDGSPRKEPKADEDLSLTAEAEEGGNKEEQLPEVAENGVTDDSHPAPTAGEAVEPQPIDSKTPADELMQDVVAETNADKEPTASQTMETQMEQTPEAQESQKRKRRSLTPPPSEEAIARKRVRPNDDDATNGGIAPQVYLPEDKKLPQAESQPEEDMKVDVRTTEKPHDSNTHETRGTRDSPPPTKTRDFQKEMDFERDVVPSVHPATPALYIKNFMRPLRPNEVQAHLVDLATRGEETIDDDIIVDFFLDQIRTHAFVVFKSTSAASRVRAALHDSVWPNESNRKPLWVDFVPREKVHDWIDKEESSGRHGPRWEVVYEDGPDGEIEAHLEPGNASISRQGNRPPPRPTSNTTDAIPLGPRGSRDAGAPPTGPRAVRPGSGPGPRPPPSVPTGDSHRTRAQPVIYYQVVSDDLARRRIENMRSFYTTDHDRDLGREINRYSFESGDVFVDRGKEIFEGIRPPHRERERNFDRDRRGFGGGGGRRGRGGRGGRGGGGGGGGRFGHRSDRYMPGGGGYGHDDRRPRYKDSNDMDRDSPRYDDDRESFRTRDTRDHRY